jgi:hypothetical protein
MYDQVMFAAIISRWYSSFQGSLLYVLPGENSREILKNFSKIKFLPKLLQGARLATPISSSRLILFHTVHKPRQNEVFDGHLNGIFLYIFRFTNHESLGPVSTQLIRTYDTVAYHTRWHAKMF